ncbi:hypothetical protein T4B_6479 [Trichinella pseudospiralis]|uniref:Uncharacterized protein n=1 Tax=Trichinella pseudospiralis TaxID=6337 RepID=A0A0V1I615_TRIPS|nr:hypothetical protein T4B_6479 [Trichinella pseudospiralis]
MGVTHATRKESSMLAIVRNASREEYPHFIATYTSPGAFIALVMLRECCDCLSSSALLQ